MRRFIAVSILFCLFFFVGGIQAGDESPCPSCVSDQKMTITEVIKNGEVFNLTNDAGVVERKMLCLKICEDVYQCVVIVFKKPELETGISEHKLAKIP